MNKKPEGKNPRKDKQYFPYCIECEEHVEPNSSYFYCTNEGCSRFNLLSVGYKDYEDLVLGVHKKP